jgi:hypothetical protein
MLGPEEKINAERIEIHPGDVTGNNLTQVARLGAKAGWLGLIGDDETGSTRRVYADDPRYCIVCTINAAVPEYGSPWASNSIEQYPR